MRRLAAFLGSYAHFRQRDSRKNNGRHGISIARDEGRTNFRGDRARRIPQRKRGRRARIDERGGRGRHEPPQKSSAVNGGGVACHHSTPIPQSRLRLRCCVRQQENTASQSQPAVKEGGAGGKSHRKTPRSDRSTPARPGKTMSQPIREGGQSARRGAKFLVRAPA